MSVTVSVVMPVCGAARALPSVLATRIPDGVAVDLIVVDDAADAPVVVPPGAPFPVRVLRHDARRGLPAARNAGLAAATGDYVWFVGGDDWVDPELLASLTSAAPDADIVVAGTVPVSEDGVTGPPLPLRDTTTVWTGPQAVEEFLYRRIRSGVTNKLVRRALLDGLTFPHGPRHEDVAIMAWLLLRARTVAFVAGPAYFHLRRPASRFNPRTAERSAAVDEALFVLDGAGSPAARQHFRLRAGALAVAGAAARSSAGELSVDAWDAVDAARRGLHPVDAWTALRHRQVVLAAAVLLIRAAPAMYVRLYRAARAADRHRHARLGRPWRGEAAAVAAITPPTVPAQSRPATPPAPHTDTDTDAGTIAVAPEPASPHPAASTPAGDPATAVEPTVPVVADPAAAVESTASVAAAAVESTVPVAAAAVEPTASVAAAAVEPTVPVAAAAVRAAVPAQPGKAATAETTPVEAPAPEAAPAPRRPPHDPSNG